MAMCPCSCYGNRLFTKLTNDRSIYKLANCVPLYDHHNGCGHRNRMVVIYNYLYNQCLSPLKFESHSWWAVLDSTLCGKVCQYKWVSTGLLFSSVTLVSFTNKIDRHNITKMLLKVALTIVMITLNPLFMNG